MSSIVQIESGDLLIVSDLHGNLPDFDRVLQQFNRLRIGNPSLQLVFLGDLIHGYNHKTDRSVEIVDFLIENGANCGGSPIHAILGNHELAHIYHLALMKGNWEFTKGFEWKIAKDRCRYVSFFEGMPLAIATAGGLLIHHSGASTVYRQGFLKEVGLAENFLTFLDHREIKNRVSKHVDDLKYNPRFGDEWMNNSSGKVLWEVLMNGNETQYGAAYHTMVDEMLVYYSGHLPGLPLRFLITGHIGVPDGMMAVGPRQVRICSGQGANDDLQKKMLLVSASRKYDHIGDVMMGAVAVY